MNSSVIHAEALSKEYHRGLHADAGLRHALDRAVKAPWSLFRRRGSEAFWALRDVSLDVHEGEVLGLIGRNGAGKTTLLKILSRITRPTSGWAEIHGRVGSLLAILGMAKTEINRKFDEIVAFAELAKFIDTPVKHYSSGMYVRLAFAVAAHLEPEILLVDEVLAVGDITFQKKCLGKMGDVARAGRTVVLVSHSMAAIGTLCSRCIILDRGAVEFDGSTEEATARYYADSLEIDSNSDLSTRPRKGTDKARFTSISIQPLDLEGRAIEVAYPGCDLRLDIELKCKTDFAPANLAVIFYDSTGYRVIDTNTAQKGEFVSLKAGETAKATFHLREVLLRPGKYLVGLWLGRPWMETIDAVEHAITLDISESEETSRHTETFPGTYLCRFEQSVAVIEPVLGGKPSS
jgi:lipopolysaccharide transport system ATP-binding protein